MYRISFRQHYLDQVDGSPTLKQASQPHPLQLPRLIEFRTSILFSGLVKPCCSCRSWGTHTVCLPRVVMTKFYQGKFFTVEEKEMTLPNGLRGRFDIVRHPGCAAMIPIFDNGDILLLKQYRQAVDNYIWEIPAGKLDHHEDPLDCAKRELIEEAGLKAKKWEKLITIYPSPGFSDEIMHIFVARDLTEVESKREKYEILTVHRLSTDTILKMIRKGEITDSKTLAALGVSFLGIN